MFSLKMVSISITAMLIVCSAITVAQETSLDLRTDGRVVTGDRKDFFLRKVATKEYKVTDYLRNKFESSAVSAIVIPPGMTGGRYLIGVVLGGATLPDDWPVSQDEFNLLRAFALNKKLAKAESASKGVRRGLASGSSSIVTLNTAELQLLIAENSSESNIAVAYAGYLLQDVAKAAEITALSDIVTKYREAEIQSIRPLILQTIEKNKLAWVKPVIISGSDTAFDTKELTSSHVQRQPGVAGGTGFLTLWYGRSLIIFPEKPGLPFDVGTDKNLFGYLMKSSPEITHIATAFSGETPTTVTKTVENADGTYTIMEYPAKKEVVLNLKSVSIQGASGVATILRDDDGTRIKLNLTNIPADVTALTLYAVDDKGVVTALGPVAITDGTGTLTATTPLSTFMLVAAPEPALTAYDANTKVFFRSGVPEGFSVIPLTSASGEKVAATTAPTTVVTPSRTVTTTYTAPMLNIPAYKKGDDTKIKVDFTGALTGARANVFITPRRDGPTEVKMRFHELKDASSGQKFVLWAVSPDNKFVKLGQVVNVPGRNEAEIKSEITLTEFGLIVTIESTDGEIPVGPAVAYIHIVP